MEKSALIYLVRHGQTEMNKEKVFRGRLDPPLNLIGHEEGRLCENFFKGISLSFIFSSPLLRAVQTAQHIGKTRNLEPVIKRELIDIDFGRWQGLTEKEVMRKYKKLFKEWKRNPQKVKFPGGENFSDVVDRLNLFLSFIKKNQCGLCGVVVTHRVVCKLLVCMLLQIPLKNFWSIKIDTGSISLLEISPDRMVVHFLNFTAHLADLKADRPNVDF